MAHEIRPDGQCILWIAEDAGGLDAITYPGAVVVDAAGTAWQLGPLSPSAAGVLVWHRCGAMVTAASAGLRFPVRVLAMEAAA